jgi:hypothetical protein
LQPRRIDESGLLFGGGLEDLHKNEEELRKAVRVARQEAEKAFGFVPQWAAGPDTPKVAQTALKAMDTLAGALDRLARVGLAGQAVDRVVGQGQRRHPAPERVRHPPPAGAVGDDDGRGRRRRPHPTPVGDPARRDHHRRDACGLPSDGLVTRYLLSVVPPLSR